MAKKAPVLKEAPVEKFVRLVEVTRPDDTHPAWQPEIILIQDGMIISREFYGKPDIWGMAYSVAQDLINPKGD